MKRFHHPEQITALIDRFNAERAQLLSDAWQDDQLADALRGTKEADRIRDLRDKAQGKRAQASWRDTRINNLKQKLSEILTPELDGCKTDGSIATS